LARGPRPQICQGGHTVRARVLAVAGVMALSTLVSTPGAAAPAHQVLTDMMVEAGYQADVTFDNGKNYGVQLIAVSRPTSVGFPVTVRLDDTKSFVGILRAVSHKNFEPVPLVWQPS